MLWLDSLLVMLVPNVCVKIQLDSFILLLSLLTEILKCMSLCAFADY